jgi:hypothetical protein
MLIKVDAGTEKYVAWAKKLAAQLGALTRDLNLFSLSRTLNPDPSTRIDITARYNGEHFIRITGGKKDFIEVTLIGTGATSVYTFRKPSKDANGNPTLSTAFTIDYAAGQSPVKFDTPPLRFGRSFEYGAAYYYSNSFGSAPKRAILSNTAGPVDLQADLNRSGGLPSVAAPWKQTIQPHLLDLQRGAGRTGNAYAESYKASVVPAAVDFDSSAGGFPLTPVPDPNTVFSPPTGVATMCPPTANTLSNGFAFAGAPSDTPAGRIVQLANTPLGLRAVAASANQFTDDPNQLLAWFYTQVYGVKLSSAAIADDGTVTQSSGRYFLPACASGKPSLSYGPATLSPSGYAAVGAVDYASAGNMNTGRNVSCLDGFSSGVPNAYGFYGDPPARSGGGLAFSKSRLKLVMSAYPWTPASDVTVTLADFAGLGASIEGHISSIVSLTDGVDNWVFANCRKSWDPISTRTDSTLLRYAFKNGVQQALLSNTVQYTTGWVASPAFTLYYPVDCVNVGGLAYFVGLAVDFAATPGSPNASVRGRPAVWQGGFQGVTLLSPYTFFGANWGNDGTKNDDLAYGYTTAANDRYTLSTSGFAWSAMDPIHSKLRQNLAFIKYSKDYYVRLVADDIAAGKTRRVYASLTSILAGAPAYAVAEELNFPGTSGSTWVPDETPSPWLSTTPNHLY